VERGKFCTKNPELRTLVRKILAFRKITLEKIRIMALRRIRGDR